MKTPFTFLSADDSQIEAVIQLEWKQFDQVQNEGGRADCQDNWTTFHIMRKSQFLAWDAASLGSYQQDLLRAEAEGRNLIAEKYARMMKSTSPEQYQEIEKRLPSLDDRRLSHQTELARIQIAWMEDFAHRYPYMAGGSRSIHASEDTPWNTSYETYFLGEVSTYSEQTLKLYGEHILRAKDAGCNLVEIIMDATARFYGYEDAKDADRRTEKLSISE